MWHKLCKFSCGQRRHEAIVATLALIRLSPPFAGSSSLCVPVSVGPSDRVLFSALLFPQQTRCDTYLQLQWRVTSAQASRLNILLQFLNQCDSPLQLIDAVLLVQGSGEIAVIDIQRQINTQREQNCMLSGKTVRRLFKDAILPSC